MWCTSSVNSPLFSLTAVDAIRRECAEEVYRCSLSSRVRCGGHPTASLDTHLSGCIIQLTYGFGLAPLTRGKLFQGQGWEQRQHERLREFAERALVHRSNFADEPLRVEQARLREVGNRF